MLMLIFSFFLSSTRMKKMAAEVSQRVYYQILHALDVHCELDLRCCMREMHTNHFLAALHHKPP